MHLVEGVDDSHVNDSSRDRLVVDVVPTEQSDHHDMQSGMLLCMSCMLDDVSRHRWQLLFCSDSLTLLDQALAAAGGAQARIDKQLAEGKRLITAYVSEQCNSVMC